MASLGSFLLLASFVDTRERKEEMSRLYVSAQEASEAKTQEISERQRLLEVETYRMMALLGLVGDVLRIFGLCVPHLHDVGGRVGDTAGHGKH